MAGFDLGRPVPWTPIPSRLWADAEKKERLALDGKVADLAAPLRRPKIEAWSRGLGSRQAHAVSHEVHHHPDVYDEPEATHWVDRLGGWGPVSVPPATFRARPFAEV